MVLSLLYFALEGNSSYSTNSPALRSSAFNLSCRILLTLIAKYRKVFVECYKNCLFICASRLFCSVVQRLNFLMILHHGSASSVAFDDCDLPFIVCLVGEGPGLIAKPQQRKKRKPAKRGR